MRRRSPAVYYVLIVLTAITLFAADRLIPHQHLHWRALDIEAPTGASTRTQLFRLSLSTSKTCMNLADNALNFSSVPAEPKNGEGQCGWTVAREVVGSNSGLLSKQAVMQCPLAIGTYVWIREIDDLAQKYFDVPLKRIHHFGTYSCRKQRGNSGVYRSEHSFANAWDISAFELENGEKISVLKHWNDGDRNQKKFLRGVHKEACKIFRVTLGPDYNAAHKDHFHVDMGPTTSCS